MKKTFNAVRAVASRGFTKAVAVGAATLASAQSAMAAVDLTGAQTAVDGISGQVGPIGTGIVIAIAALCVVGIAIGLLRKV